MRYDRVLISIEPELRRKAREKIPEGRAFSSLTAEMWQQWLEAGCPLDFIITPRHTSPTGAPTDGGNEPRAPRSRERKRAS